ncbi:DUF4386 family protein [Micromonospora sp. B11E3]|uniref:DUF4386 family protein n=1 Tax=Micromonospora sp. B11E3 TaxID=3153562 RepID=UPI00325DEDAF
MDDNRMNRLGGTCAILVGVSYVVVTTFFVLDPTQFIPHENKDELWRALAADGTPRVLYYWGYALGAVFAFGAIPAIADLVRERHEGWVRWTTGLAYLSFGVTAVETFRLVTATPLWAGDYAGGDPTVQTAIVTTDLLLRLDPATWLRFGALGPWFLVVNILALRHGLLRRPLAYLGIALGVLTSTTAVGVAFGIGPMVLVSAILGGALAAPIWFIWVGLVLRRGVPRTPGAGRGPATAAGPAAAGAVTAAQPARAEEAAGA